MAQIKVFYAYYIFDDVAFDNRLLQNARGESLFPNSPYEQSQCDSAKKYCDTWNGILT